LNIVFLAHSDFAASGNGCARALRLLGHDTKCFVSRLHPFGYPHQGVVGTRNEIRSAIDESGVVFLIQGTTPKTVRDLKIMKPLVPMYGGNYRFDHAEFNQRFNHRSLFTMMYEADMMGHGATNEHLILPPVDTDFLKPTDRPIGDPPIVGHFPSTPEHKGTPEILAALLPLHDEGLIEVRSPFFRATPAGDRGHHAQWDQQIVRMSECDIIVDQIKPTIHRCGGRPRVRGRRQRHSGQGPHVRFGEWVQQAMESAALGKVLYTNSHNPQPYHDTYGEYPGFTNVLTPEALAQDLRELVASGHEEIRRRQGVARDWVVRNHSLAATAKVIDGFLDKYKDTVATERKRHRRGGAR